MHDHRQIDPAAQPVIKNGFVRRMIRRKTRIVTGIVGQDMIHLAHQQRADRAVGNRGVGQVAPIRINAILVSRVKPPVDTHNADVQMIMRHDLGDFGGNRSDGRPKIKLASQQSRNAKELVQADGTGDAGHGIGTLPDEG